MMNSEAIAEKPFKIPESVLVVIYTADLEVLLLERADRPGYWQSVTGSKAHREESACQTAIREVFEETGITIGSDAVPCAALRDWDIKTTYEIYPHWRHRYEPGVTENLEHTFGLLVPRDIPLRLNPREHLQHVWMDWPSAAKRCFSPSNAAAIRDLPKRRQYR